MDVGDMGVLAATSKHSQASDTALRGLPCAWR